MERTESMTAASAPHRELAGSYVDWPAVFGGTVVAAAIAGLFTTFGAAIGLTSLAIADGITIWLIVTALWIVVSLVAAFWAGGYVAGRMRRRLDEASADEVGARDGINGLVVWGLATLLAGWMAASVVSTAVTATGAAVGGVAQAAGTAVGGAVQATGAALGNAAGGIAQAAGAVADDDSEGILAYVNDSLLRPAVDGAEAATTGTVATPTEAAAAPEDLARQTGVVLANILRTGEIDDADRAFLVDATAEQTGLTEAEVEERVDAAITRVQDTRAQAMQMVEDAQAEAERLAAEAEQAAMEAAETARRAGILTAFLLTASALVAGAAAVTGAVRGGRHRDEGRLFGGFGYRIG